METGKDLCATLPKDVRITIEQSDDITVYDKYESFHTLEDWTDTSSRVKRVHSRASFNSGSLLTITVELIDKSGSVEKTIPASFATIEFLDSNL